jgi:activator of 2-hydroxyglutaryl-CoA dehydratase
MQYTHILGIDLSKATIDLALMDNKASASIVSKKFTNNLKGYEAFLTWIEEEKINIKQVLICLENTGIYGRCLIEYLAHHKASVWVENPNRSNGVWGLSEEKQIKWMLKGYARMLTGIRIKLNFIQTKKKA